MKSRLFYTYFGALIGCILLVFSCISPKDSMTSRGMQNLTARYNIIYNANTLLDESARNIENAYIDNYANILSIYKEPTEALSNSESGVLDSIINKANAVINDKLHSHFVDDAYMLVAKANHLKSQFFNASEYFEYLNQNYPKEHKLRQESFVWKARSLMQLENLHEAAIAMDSALKHIELSKKKKRADVYATYAQLLILQNKPAEAIPILIKALEAGVPKRKEIRWKFVLAQLQEKNKQYENAYENFSDVVRSNASFEMAFNANLNRIRIEEEQSGKQLDRVTRLRSLLKDDKNKDFVDQIFYNIGNIHLERNELDAAIENYKTSIRQSTNNQNQKGLSYLKLADIYFDSQDYVLSKSYYDSTVTALSPKYPGYDLIKKKSDNLQLLASKYQVISREDTLQALAKLPQAEREARIAELIQSQTVRVSNSASQQNPTNILALNSTDNRSASNSPGGKFYFSNTAAVGQGFSEFKRRWGNRPMEDNWRRSQKTAAESTESMSADPDAPAGAATVSSSGAVDTATLRRNYLNTLPLTEPLMQASNQRIAEAYFDIGNFYKDELEDELLAIRAFEELLNRTPQSDYTLPTYYSLYRLYQEPNPEKSNTYRDLILSKYPDSPFAKAIRDPNYSREEDEKEQQLNTAYDAIFNLYSDKKYREVLPAIQRMEQQFGNNKLSPQLAYLHALAVGHTAKVPAFESILRGLVQSYPEDKLVTPLAKQHLQFINANRTQMAGRPTALLDYDPLIPNFEEDEVPVYTQTQKPVAPTPSQNQATTTSNNQAATTQKPPAAQNPPATQTLPTITLPEQSTIPQTQTAVVPNPSTSQPEPEPRTEEPVAVVQPVPAETVVKEEVVGNLPSKATQATPPVKKPAGPSIFNLPAEAEYYFVINVSDARYNLSSSRFGIGQFNRTRYTGTPLRHQLQDVGNENQLVFVGAFKTFEDVKTYESSIVPLLKDIMKVPADQYTTFVISKEGLDKLKDRQMINSYLEFYKTSQ